jgi:inhibitor of cysteine peptidase
MTGRAPMLLALCVTLVGCSHGFTDLTPDPGGVSMIATTGTVRHQDIEGGFFGIIADDSTRYDPVELAPALQKDGLRVKFSARPANNGLSTHMWGRRVELTSIEPLR